MTPRLLSICSFVQMQASVIDVGTDHAYIPVYLAKNRIIRTALATDVHDGPLARAEENIRRFGFMNIIQTKKANGLQSIDVSSYDTIIIAGMGGELIADILLHAPDLSGKSLVLQPMTASEELRRFLSRNGYKILAEKLSRERNKIYVTMHVVRGEFGEYSPLMYRLGKETKGDILYPMLLEKEKEKLSRMLEGQKHAKISRPEIVSKLEALLREIENNI